MIETILVPIDVAETDTGGDAVTLAKEIAGAHGAKLILLNVVEQVPSYVAAQIPAGFHEKALKNAEASLSDIVRSQKLPASTEVQVREGHPSTEILECAREVGAGMIVITSHDPGLVDYLLGSVAARVVRHAHCSVLVARKLEL